MGDTTIPVGSAGTLLPNQTATVDEAVTDALQSFDAAHPQVAQDAEVELAMESFDRTHPEATPIGTVDDRALLAAGDASVALAKRAQLFASRPPQVNLNNVSVATTGSGTPDRS